MDQSVQSSRYGDWLSHDDEAGNITNTAQSQSEGYEVTAQRWIQGNYYGGELCHDKLRRVVVALVVVIIFLASNDKTTREEGIVPCRIKGKR
mmetsp:Transcript_26920/g.40021  ORF Transcript_26920/g.40021 Transcript_26920/m.40021 type:complete len:92 (+) Transcript_26920:1357-1632(+)